MKQQYFYNTDLTLFDSQYTGWVNLYDNSIYKSKYKQNEQLTGDSNPLTIAYTSNFYTDWTINEEKVYPYQLKDILLQPNEIVTAHALNDTFKKLYTNIEYLVSRCVFYSNENIPTDYIGWFGCALNMQDPHDDIKDVTYYVDAEYQFHTPTKSCYQYYPCQYASLSNIKLDSDIYNYRLGVNIENRTYQLTANFTNALYDEYSTAENYINLNTVMYDNIVDIINFNTPTKQISLIITASAILMKQFILSDNNTYTIKDLYSGELSLYNCISSINGYTFKNINSASLSDSGYLYISDINSNSIYQFDLRFIINDDSVIKTPKLINIIGGLDTVENNKLYKFSNIQFIKCVGKYLFVYDNIEHIIIVFDKFLNYVTVNSGVVSSKNLPVGIIYRDLLDEYCLVCENATYHIFDSLFNYKSSHILSDITEKCVAAAQSSIDSNIYYIVTETAVLEKMFSNDETIGYFTFNKYSISNDDLKWWRSTYIPWNVCDDLWGGSYNFPSFMNTFNIYSMTVRNVANKDEIWIYANNGRLLWFQNELKQKSLFKNNSKLLYNKINILCAEQEYVQSFTYNKIIRKFVDILNTIIDNIEYTPIYEYNSLGEKIYMNLKNVDNKYVIPDEYLKNIKIYDNDILSVDVINRTLTYLFKIEQDILNVTKPKLANSQYNITQNVGIEIKE